MKTDWKTAVEQLRREDAKPPQGCKSLEEIAEEIEMTTESAKKLVDRLVKAGKAERVPGKKLTAAGQVINCNYYRLVGKPR